MPRQGADCTLPFFRDMPLGAVSRPTESYVNRRPAPVNSSGQVGRGVRKVKLEGTVTWTDPSRSAADRSGCEGEQRELRLSEVSRKGWQGFAGGDMAVAHTAAVVPRVIVLLGRRARERPVAGSVIGGVIVRFGRQRRGRGRLRDAVVDRARPHPEGLSLGRREEHGGKENSGRATYERGFANHPRFRNRSYHSIEWRSII